MPFRQNDDKFAVEVKDAVQKALTPSAMVVGQTELQTFTSNPNSANQNVQKAKTSNATQVTQRVDPEWKPSAKGVSQSRRVADNTTGFECHVCGLNLSTRSAVKVHMRVHTGEKNRD